MGSATRKCSGEKRDRYYTIINHCYEKGISLVITSNMSSRELACFPGRRVMVPPVADVPA